ncbi:unnamed protein product [marine sediment metagenome]|uniref:Uncharacterized protein n=1 Tax=marine sediment metagenome TaxID=412755 RepID=X0SCH2_9ZZZZ
MSQSEKEKFQAHFLWIVNVIFWIKNHWLVFVVMGGMWTFLLGTLIQVLFIPMAIPVVKPIIEAMWENSVAPYDSMTVNFEKRIKNLESEHFPAATK